MPRFFGPPTVSDGKGGGNTITVGGATVNVTAPPGADARAIGHIVKKEIRAANDSLARDIAATVQE